MNQLYVGIDVGSAKNAAYLMKPDGSKHSSFSVQNNPSGAKLLTERIVSALTAWRPPRFTEIRWSMRSGKMDVSDVSSERSMCSIQSRSISLRKRIPICRRTTLWTLL